MPNPQAPPFKRYCAFSACIHLILLLLGVVMAPQMHLATVPAPISVVMVELPKGPSEDIGLGIPETTPQPEAPPIPETTPPPTKPPEPVAKPMIEPKPVITPPQKPVVKTPPKPELSPVERKMRDALGKIDQQLHTRNAPANSTQPASPGFKYGTSDKPLKEIPPEAELMRYRATVRARILREWIAPAGIRDLPPGNRPSVRISVHIGPSGHITSSGFAKKSSNAAFDASAMRAVQRANPLPTPPPSVRDMATAQGFTIDFVVR